MIFTALFRAWVALAAGLIAGGWIASVAGDLELMKYVGPAWLVAVIAWVTLQLRRNGCEEWHDLRRFILFWPFLVLLGLISAAAILYPPTTFDSLAYRLPRIFIWLQENKVMHVPVSDERLNYLAHNWELFALPWVADLGGRAAGTQNIAAWLVLYLACISLSKRYCGNFGLQQWVALLGVVGFFPVLQASGTANDLFAVVFVVLSAWFFWQGRDRQSAADFVWSGLSLALAAGTKPNFSVLALFWLLGLMVCYPWREKWAGLLLRGGLVLPLALLVSPLPTFVLNYANYKKVMGPIEGSEMAMGTPLEKIQAAILMTAWGNLQPPVNPLARKWNSTFEKLGENWSLRQNAPKFNLVASEVPIVDSAAQGMVATLAWLAGVVLAVRFRRVIRPEVWLMAAAGLTGLLLASSSVIASTMARSFMGFVYLSLPLAMAGLSYGPERIVKILVSAAVLTSCLVMVLTPGKPMWPSRAVLAWLETHRPSDASTAMLARYVVFRERNIAGSDLVQLVPADATIVAVMGGGEPLLQLWQPYDSKRRVLFLQPGENLESERIAGAEYVLVGGIGYELHEQAINELKSGKTHYSKVASQQYTSQLQKGPREWSLFKKTD